MKLGGITYCKTLYKLKNNGTEICEELAVQLNFIQKSSYELSIAVVGYFKCIELQCHSSPHMPTLSWLGNVPEDAHGANSQDAIAFTG